MSAGLLNSIVALITLAGLAWLLYRPKIQKSGTYKATVVPLAEIMDVGFIVFSPVIILSFGYDATWAMLGLCLLAILTGFATSYTIQNYEPLIGKPDPLHRWNSIALWALLAASVVNVGYYAQLLMTLVWLPLGDLYSPGLVTATAAALLGILAIYGFAKGLMALNDLGNKSTAFNLSAIVAVLVAFAAYNVQRLVGGDFDLPHFNAPDNDEAFRKLLGLFVLVQGFESSRYIGAYFSAERRVKTMRSAQYISSAVYVLFVAFVADPLCPRHGSQQRDGDLRSLQAGQRLSAVPDHGRGTRQSVIRDRERHRDPNRDAGPAGRRSVAQAVDLPAVPGPGDSRRAARPAQLGSGAGLPGIRRLLPVAGADRRAARVAGREMGLGRPLRRRRLGDGRGSGPRDTELSRGVALRLKLFGTARLPLQESRMRASSRRGSFTQLSSTHSSTHGLG